MIEQILEVLHEWEITDRSVILQEYTKIYSDCKIVLYGISKDVNEAERELKNENIKASFQIAKDNVEMTSSLRTISVDELYKMEPQKTVVFFCCRNTRDRLINLCKELKIKSTLKAISELGEIIQDKRFEKKVIKKGFLCEYTYNRNYSRPEWVEYYTCHDKDLQSVRERLYDEESKKVLDEYLRAIIQNDYYNYHELKPMYKYFCDYDGVEMYTHLKNEVWVNCGSCYGDTIFRFISRGYDYSTIYGFEGDKKTFKRLKTNIEMLDESRKSRIELRNEYIGVKGEKNSMDSIFKETKISFINCDIEGAEIGLLRGAESVIKRDRPVIAICVYHSAEHIIEIPKLIEKYAIDYEFFLRKAASWRKSPFRTGETFIVAVPQERMVCSSKSVDLQK